jgi:hypothetical protein
LIWSIWSIWGRSEHSEQSPCHPTLPRSRQIKLTAAITSDKTCPSQITLPPKSKKRIIMTIKNQCHDVGCPFM